MSNVIADTFTNYATWGGWWGAVYAGIGLALAINVLGWFWAGFTQDEKLKTWVKREIVQLGYSMLIAVLAVMLVTSTFLPQMLYYASQWGGSQEWSSYIAARCIVQAGNIRSELPCHIAIAADYLQILFKASENEAAGLLSAYSVLGVLQSISIEVKGLVDPAGILMVTPLIGLSVPLETIGIVLDLTQKNMMIIRAQQFFLEFLHLAFFPFFLSLGLLLRPMFFTRRLGGLLIALALSFYIAYPMMYVFFHGVLFSIAGPWNYAGKAPTPGGTDLDTIYSMKIDWKNIATLKAVSGQDFAALKSGDDIYDGAGNKAFAGIAVSKITQGEKSFVATMDGVAREYVAVRGSSGFSVYETSITGTAGVVPNAPSGQFAFPAGRVVTSEFREKYGSPQDPQFGRDINKVKALNAEIYTGLCLDQQPRTQEEINKNKDQVRLASLKAEDKLYQGYIGGLFMVLDPVTGSLLGYNGPLDNFAKVLVFSLIAPFIAIMVALASVKVFSPLLGGDVEIAGLTRII